MEPLSRARLFPLIAMAYLDAALGQPALYRTAGLNGANGKARKEKRQKLKATRQARKKNR